MKYRILIWMFLIGCLAGCREDDEIGFAVPVEFRKIAFDPIPGGAVMRYRLPDNLDIFGVRARYVNAYGQELIKEGTYLSDTILLDGFTEAQTDVPVSVTFFNNSMQESEPLALAFKTQPAATVALFDELTVNPFWGGFNVTYTSPSIVEGTVHVFYIGINPATRQQDSILVGSYPILEGGDTLNFVLKQALDKLDVVVRTDDFDGHRVRTRIYENIPALAMEKLSPEQFEFSTDAEIVENTDREVGLKYLFDGNKKGLNYKKNYMEGNKGKEGYRKYGTFLAGPNAFEKRFVIDFGEPRVPAMVCGDAFLYFGTYWPVPPMILLPGINDNYDRVGAEYWHGSYMSRLPCKLKLFGTNAADPLKASMDECTLLYALDEPSSAPYWDKAWCRFTDYCYANWGYNNPGYLSLPYSEFEELEPITLEMKCNYTGEAFRYVFFEVYDTYGSMRNGSEDYEENDREYVTFDELEVYVKMENK